jgi:CheY-like chemotaxis protein
MLLVEDDEMTRTLLGTLLRKFGSEVCAAKSAEEALTLADTFDPHVIISDIGMPRGDDGVALLQKLRRNGQPPVPAIAVTGYADELMKQRVLAAGFDAFLSKPIDPEEFVSTVERVLRRS